jgi:hypothetical protein
MCLFGYNGRLRANVIADGSVFPHNDDVERFIKEFEKEVMVLAQELGLRDQDCFTEPAAKSDPRKLATNGATIAKVLLDSNGNCTLARSNRPINELRKKYFISDDNEAFTCVSNDAP